MSARQEETEKLIRELEALRNFLIDDSSTSESLVINNAPPVSRKPAAKPATVSYLNVKSVPGMGEAVKDELRSQAAPLIQEFIDKEMMQLEHQLIQTLNQHLENWMESYNFNQPEKPEPENSYYHSNQQ
ncbi:hypothetical protein ACH42_08620 [Endozoicomonas sp. (ex Bugula neritina AB1)]|nr:hypothetical protein ACH42_08620 [Endozoicomonas sp. (ex Bugula neritina AB1)]